MNRMDIHKLLIDIKFAFVRYAMTIDADGEPTAHRDLMERLDSALKLRFDPAEEEIAVLQDALEPFAEAAPNDAFGKLIPDSHPAIVNSDPDRNYTSVTVGDLRRARAAGRREG